MSARSGGSAYARYVCLPLEYAGAGYFCSYVLGLFVAMLARIPALSILTSIAHVLSADSILIGAVIGAAVSLAFETLPVCVLSAAVAGAIGYSFAGFLTAILASYACALLAHFVAGKTRADILLIPIVCTAGGILCALLLAEPINRLYALCAQLLIRCTALPTFLAYTAIAALAALYCVTPLSMFTIASALTAGGLSGAAFIGCCAAMVSFAAASYRDNGLCVALSHALGTPRLQMGNLMKNPLILLCPLLSAALGGLCAGAFGFTCAPSAIAPALTMLGGVAEVLSVLPTGEWLFALGKIAVCAVGVPLLVTIPMNRMLRATRAMANAPMRVDF